MDGSTAGGAKLGFGNNWIVAAIVVTLPFCSRPVALPVLATLAVKGGERSKPDLARDLVDALAERFGDRRIDLVADAAYGCGVFAGLGRDMTITTRARCHAAFYEPAPPRTGKRGRPRLKGDRVGTPTDIAASATWKTTTVTRYGTTTPVQITERTCLWYGTWRTDPVRVILLRDTGAHERQRVRARAGHHRPHHHRAGDHPLRRPMEHRGDVSRREEHPRGRASPQPRHQGRGTDRRIRAVLPTACSSSGTPCTATRHRTSRAAGLPRPGTGRRLNPRPWTCSPCSAAISSPRDFCPQPPDQPQPKNGSSPDRVGLIGVAA
ncbi:MAG: transposase [Actinomycetota bacterium]|nr:transposase [Actinomycetota bacterium]